jgi:ABC-2 type transport system ATP-binding protein
VTATGLRKVYPAKRGPVEAVAGIDLDVRAGEFFGLLGPNGAGKSTTIGMLTTLVRPTSGSVRIAGFDTVRQPVQVRRRISLVSQTNSVDRELTVEENLRYRARYWGCTRAAARVRAGELLEQFGLGDRRDAMFYQLSGGQLRRMMIARALVQRPEILFLDEPTSGIDPHSRVNVWDVLGELHESGQTIVLTTHNIEEAERFCRRAAIIDNGRVLVCDEVSALIASAGGVSVVTATYDGPVSGIDFGSLPVVQDGASVRVSTAATDGLIAELVALGATAGRRLLDVSTTRPSLESAFLTLTGRAYRA